METVNKIAMDLINHHKSHSRMIEIVFSTEDLAQKDCHGAITMEQLQPTYHTRIDMTELPLVQCNFGAAACQGQL